MSGFCPKHQVDLQPRAVCGECYDEWLGKTPDANADYGRLWLAVHDYMITQNTTDASLIARAYDEMVEAHNMIHARYIEHQERPLEIAGA